MTFERKIQSQEESLHWISYNLKMLAQEMKAITPILKDIAEKLKSTPF
jgi:hypothetical protein